MVQTLIFVPGWVHDPLGEADVVLSVDNLTHDPRPLALGGVVGTRLGLESPVPISLGWVRPRLATNSLFSCFNVFRGYLTDFAVKRTKEFPKP